MIKKPAAMLVAVAVALWGLTVPATAQTPAEVPEKPNFEQSAGHTNEQSRATALKRKSKKKKKRRKVRQCGAFKPGEAGADKPMVKVTDAATEEEPVEQTVELDMSLADVVPSQAGGEPSTEHFNIQVDSKAKEAGLYVLIEFPTRRDYDLNLLHTDGSYAARSRGFNTVVETPLSTTGHGGESTPSSEKLVGIKTSDCGGWTLEVANYLGEGGEFDIKLWLGEAETDPQAPGEET